MIELDGNCLSIEQIWRVANQEEKVSLSESGKRQIQASHDRLLSIIEKGKPVYGINTGFGLFADKRIDLKDSARLSRNLILSHAVGTGAYFDREVVRAAMLIRANALAKGFSGVSLPVVTTLLEMLNGGVTPLIPSQGSLGSSGDLCHLAHMALVFTTDEDDLEDESGLAIFDGRTLTGKAAMQAAGIPRIVLGAKEGLAISNGATFCAAIAALAITRAEYLLYISQIATALTLEALLGCSAAFDPRLHAVRGQAGQQEVAQEILRHLEGSNLIDMTNAVQDAYSLRCAPQVMGAVKDTITYAKRIIEQEINAATDNPLIFEPDIVLSGGNFHGEPIGLTMDYLGIAICELGAISERRINRLVDGRLNNGLPPMLVDSFDNAGLNSGLMMPQYTAASLVLENQTLATPDTIRSLPTSGQQEDHNANATNAARHTMHIIQNTKEVLAIELFTAARAIDLRLNQIPEGKLGKGTQTTYEKIRKHISPTEGDQLWAPKINILAQLIDPGRIF